ncbi:hypothetical protein [Longispora albida]|uniref:hypothetical protein n=1 Tax=Longispora albida TaxID=203523 RepID=UPI00036D9B0D|nr:hypothetical protein [Longispora albida]
MRGTRILAVTIGACTLLALAGCATEKPAAQGTPSGSAASEDPQPVAVLPQTKAWSPSPVNACPVTKETLLAAAKGHPVAAEMHQPIELMEPQCVERFAMVWTSSYGGTLQPNGLLFVYTQGAWRLQGAGSELECTAKYNVPAEVASQLQGCAAE